MNKSILLDDPWQLTGEKSLRLNATKLIRCPDLSPNPKIGSHLRTPALKTESFSEKIDGFSKTRKWIY